MWPQSPSDGPETKHGQLQQINLLYCSVLLLSNLQKTACLAYIIIYFQAGLAGDSVNGILLLKLVMQ